MIENIEIKYLLTTDTSRIKSCHHNPEMLLFIKQEHKFYIEIILIGIRQKNGDLNILEDFHIVPMLTKILSGKDFVKDCDKEEQDFYIDLVLESLSLVKVYLEYDWQFNFSLLDKDESESINNHKLVNAEIAAVKELVKLLSIRDNFDRSEMTITHTDSNNNQISEDNFIVDRETYKEFFDNHLEEKLATFKRDYAFNYFGSSGSSKTKMADLVTSNSILTVLEEKKLEFEFSLVYFTALLEQISIYKMIQNKSARRLFNSLVAKSLMKFLDILIEQFNVSHKVTLKDKYLYIFSVFRVYGMIPFENESLRPLEGNHIQKENYIKRLFTVNI